VRLNYAGIVTARSVQVLSALGTQEGNEYERDRWWKEVRIEI